MQLFVTGTDTGVGKTIVSAWLCRHLQADYWKPVQTGAGQDDDSATVAELAGCRTHPPRWALSLPASPHLAAREAEQRIAVADFALPDASRLIVEGAGGVLVPLNEEETLLSLMQRLQLPVVVAARSGLGTLNHTGLTLMALRQAGLTVAGIVLVGDAHPDNRSTLARRAPVLGELPVLDPLDAAALAGVPLSVAARQRLETVA